MTSNVASQHSGAIFNRPSDPVSVLDRVVEDKRAGEDQRLTLGGEHVALVLISHSTVWFVFIISDNCLNNAVWTTFCPNKPL